MVIIIYSSIQRYYFCVYKDSPGFYSARSFFGWYNGLPEYREVYVCVAMKTL